MSCLMVLGRLVVLRRILLMMVFLIRIWFRLIGLMLRRLVRIVSLLRMLMLRLCVRLLLLLICVLMRRVIVLDVVLRLVGSGFRVVLMLRRRLRCVVSLVLSLRLIFVLSVRICWMIRRIRWCLRGVRLVLIVMFMFLVSLSLRIMVCGGWCLWVLWLSGLL